MARLKPGVTMAQAKADVRAIAGRIRDKDKRDRTFTIDVVPLARVGRRRRAAGGAGAARIGGAGAADRLRERREPAADARDGPAEGGRGPHGARRRLAAAGAPAADREPAARPARRRGRAAHRARPRSTSSAPSIPATSRGSTRSASTARCSPSRSASRSSPASCSAWRPRCARPVWISTRRSRPAAGTRRARAASAARGAGCAACWSSSEVAISLMLLDRRRPAHPQLRAAAERVARLRPGGRHLDAARRQRPPVRRIATPRSRTSATSRDKLASVPGRQRARRGVVAAVHLVGRLGIDQRRRLDAAARPGTAGRSARARRRTTSGR